MSSDKRLDELGELWFSLSGEENKAVRLKVQNEIFEEIWKNPLLSMNRDEYQFCVTNFITEVWTKGEFDPNRAPLSHYVRSIIGKRQKDWLAQDMSYRRTTVKEMADGVETSKRKYIYDTSLNISPNEEDDRELQDTMVDEKLQDMDSAVIMESRLWEMISVFLNLPKYLRGKANNPTKINYYKMFYTDGISSVMGGIRSREEYDAYYQHERGLFESMKLPFLDYYMKDICSNVAEIINSGRKTHSELLGGNDQKELGFPLPAKVLIQYLSEKENTKVSDAAVSQQKDAYQTFMDEVIQK